MSNGTFMVWFFICMMLCAIWFGLTYGNSEKQVCYDHNFTGLEYHPIWSKQYVCYNTIIENGTKVDKLGLVET